MRHSKNSTHGHTFAQSAEPWMAYTLHIPAVYLDSNSTWHSSLGGVSVITRGEDVHGTQGPPRESLKQTTNRWRWLGAGVFLQDQAGWIQDVPLNINITDSASGTLLVTPHTAHTTHLGRRKGGALTRHHRRTGVRFDYGGTWQQNGVLTLLSQGYQKGPHSSLHRDDIELFQIK